MVRCSRFERLITQLVGMWWLAHSSRIVSHTTTHSLFFLPPPGCIQTQGHFLSFPSRRFSFSFPAIRVTHFRSENLVVRSLILTHTHVLNPASQPGAYHALEQKQRKATQSGIESQRSVYRTRNCTPS
uniref:Putative secreted peptide n=1 Tax=Anopheles braziliensis TaxID=58242 RepID=A0A2M3ZW25_9DIPT